MDTLWKRATNYRALAHLGVTCGALRQDFLRGPNSWTLECWKDGEVSPDKAKSWVEIYLKEEFQATHISYFQKKNGGPNRFFVHFVSYAL